MGMYSRPEPAPTGAAVADLEAGPYAHGLARRLADHLASANELDLRSLRPLDDETIMASVARTRRAIIIDEENIQILRQFCRERIFILS